MFLHTIVSLCSYLCFVVLHKPISRYQSMYWAQEVAKIRSLQQGFDINKTLPTTEENDLPLLYNDEVSKCVDVIPNPYIESKSKPLRASNTNSTTGNPDTSSSTFNRGRSKQKICSAAGGRSKKISISKEPPSDNPFDFDHSEDEEGSKLLESDNIVNFTIYRIRLHFVKYVNIYYYLLSYYIICLF